MSDDIQEKKLEQTVEFDKIYLQQNIIPSIQSSVKNRYLIISGVTTYIALVLSEKNPEIVKSKCVVYFMFLVFIFLNSYNYYSNAKNQEAILNRYSVMQEPSKYIDFWFSGCMIVAITIGFFVII